MRHLPLLIVITLFFSSLSIGCNNSSEVDSKDPGIILLRYATGSESTTKREQGFLETITSEYPQINVISSDQYAGTNENLSLDKAQQLLLKFEDRIEGVFAVCESNALGVLRALEQEDRAESVQFVGFDPNEQMVEALADGKMKGIVLQDPVQMGYLSVKTMVAHLSGEEVEKRISTGEFVATPDNMETEPYKSLLQPAQISESPEPPENVKYRIAVIPKGLGHEFWKSVHYGAQKAADELGNVEILYKGPQKENDLEQQINLVQDFITKKVDGICLAPLDSQGLVSPVEEAKDAGISVVIFDSGLNDESSIVSYVATDNYNGGVLAAHCLAKALGHEKPAEKSAEEAAE